MGFSSGFDRPRVPGLAVLVILSVSGCLFAQGCSRTQGDGHEQAITDAPSADADSSATMLDSTFPRPMRDEAIDFHRVQKRDESQRLIAAYRCRSADCRLEPLGAASEAEARWLQARGFPGPEREQELERMSEGALAAEADNGDLAAQAILGRRRTEAGRKASGMGAMHHAAVAGSVFADYQMSRALRKVDVIDSAAYLRRAYLQGDSKAAQLMYRVFPDFSRIEWNMVDARAMVLYDGLLQQRAGKRGFPYGPRPGEE